MQLRVIFIAVLSVVFTSTYAQKTFKQLDETEINFLFNYYEQDGDNAAVTGGRGTEELDNIAPSLIINIPLDSARNLITYFGFDKYSSASTDNIDNNVSSASSSDTRTYVNAIYQKNNKPLRITKSYKVGFSIEYDYTSISAGYGWAKASRDDNRELSLSVMGYYDTWQLIYPIELRGTDGLESEKNRQSVNFTGTLSQVINKKLQASFSTELVYQAGRLSTPFHRVYFTDIQTDPAANPRIERLPDSRLKIPIGMRLNYYLNDLIILRGYYRYYYDDFGITANTFEIEAPIRLATSLTLMPFYRYHTQTAAEYFRPYGEHELDAEFYTSDYDLSEINSSSVGLGVKFSPLYGLTRFKGPFAKRKNDRVTKFKSLEVRYANYTREGNNSDDPGGGDLDAFSLSFNLTFTF